MPRDRRVGVGGERCVVNGLASRQPVSIVAIARAHDVTFLMRLHATLARCCCYAMARGMPNGHAFIFRFVCRRPFFHLFAASPPFFDATSLLAIFSLLYVIIFAAVYVTIHGLSCPLFSVVYRRGCGGGGTLTPRVVAVFRRDAFRSAAFCPLSCLLPPRASLLTMPA